MILTEEVKERIIEILDSKEFISDLYYGLSEAKRKQLGQVYTPSRVCIQMIESFNCDTLAGKNILDPTCGSGNLLIACLIAGADVDKLYGNDYDSDVVALCVKRINRACEILNKPYINEWQIHQGNALNDFSLTYFGPDYLQKLEAHFLESSNTVNLFAMLTSEQEEALAAAKEAIDNVNEMLAPIREAMAQVRDVLKEPREIMKQAALSVSKIWKDI